MTRLLALLGAGGPLAGFIVLGGCAVLYGCATSPHGGRAQLAVPGPVASVYSEFNMQLTLVAMRAGPAAGDAPDAFDQRMARVGPELAAAAFRLFPELRTRIDRFEFVIVDKAEAGTVSNASGRVVILRPVSSLAPADAALAFILARELGHVIANHHAEDTAASLAISGLAYVLFPVAGIAKLLGSLFVPGGAAAAGATPSIAANASATAASLVGSRVVVLSYRSRQLEEADAIALTLLGGLGYAAAAVAAAFAPVDLKSQTNAWTAELQASLGRLAPDNDRLD